MPSISSGVVARVVEIQKPLESGVMESEERCLPVMIETTAAVHPGVSGGAVVNSDGLMIGLVTRYFYNHNRKVTSIYYSAQLGYSWNQL